MPGYYKNDLFRARLNAYKDDTNLDVSGDDNLVDLKKDIIKKLVAYCDSRINVGLNIVLGRDEEKSQSKVRAVLNLIQNIVEAQDINSVESLLKTEKTHNQEHDKTTGTLPGFKSGEDKALTASLKLVEAAREEMGGPRPG